MNEAIVDDVAGTLSALIIACGRATFPGWAKEYVNEVTGRQKTRQLNHV